MTDPVYPQPQESTRTVRVEDLREFGGRFDSWAEAVAEAAEWAGRYDDWYKRPAVYQHNGAWIWYGIRLPEEP